MIRTIFGRLVWLGRATSAVVGLAVVLALVVGVSSQALAGNLGPLKVGSLKNVATKTTALVGKVAGGSAFAVKNPSGGPALRLQVKAGQAPMTVNPEAGTAAGLSADEIDGKDSSGFLAADGKAQDAVHADMADNATNAQNAADADKLDGKDSTEFLTPHSTLKSGETLTGIWGTAANGSTTSVVYAVAPIEFKPELAAPIPSSNSHYMTSNPTAGPTANCPGRGQAAPGHLCVYESNNFAMDFDSFLAAVPSTTGAGKDGTLLHLRAAHSGSNARGTWAITAP